MKRKGDCLNQEGSKSTRGAAVAGYQLSCNRSQYAACCRAGRLLISGSAVNSIYETGEELPHYKGFVTLLGGSGSDTAELIRRRHAFFLERVYPAIRVKPLDGQRLFDALEKEVIWVRDGRKCKNPSCGRAISFRDARIHHIVEHVAGGATTLANGILICCDCHSNRKEMQNRASFFQEYLREFSEPPSGTPTSAA